MLQNGGVTPENDVEAPLLAQHDAAGKVPWTAWLRSKEPKRWRTANDKLTQRPDGRWCPEEDAGILSLLSYSYVWTIIKLGFTKTLEMEDMWDVAQWFKTDKVVAAFHEALAASKSPGSSWSILLAIWRTQWGLLLFSALLRIAYISSKFIGPLALEQLLRSLQTGGSLPWLLFLSCMMFIGNISGVAISQWYYEMLYRIKLKMKASFIDMIYRKALRVSGWEAGRQGVGAIVNLMSNDAQKLWDAVFCIHIVWTCPLQVAVTLSLLVRVLGLYPSLAALASGIVIIPWTTVVGSLLASVRKKLLAASDARIKLTTEVVTGIKAIKLYAWEGPYTERILALRKREMRYVILVETLQSLLYLASFAGPVLIAVAAFATYTALGYTLTADVAFPALAYFNLLRWPLIDLPDSIVEYVNARVGLDRLSKFLQNEEKESLLALPKAIAGQAAAEVEAGTFSWAPGAEPALRDICLRVSPGQLVVVVGEVGAGKSSLLAALLGEMHTQAGSVMVRGTVGYAAQNPWIQNATLRDNVLMGAPFDRSAYNAVLAGCALLPDLDMLPAGDLTEIGERGVNLSGGQKHRVALARACYADADVYLLDDVFSAVDSHVGRHIYDDIIMGRLADKTRIMVTHQVQFATGADFIVVIKDETIAAMGTHAELVAQGIDLRRFKAATDASAEDEGSAPASPQHPSNSTNMPSHPSSTALPVSVTIPSSPPTNEPVPEIADNPTDATMINGNAPNIAPAEGPTKRPSVGKRPKKTDSAFLYHCENGTQEGAGEDGSAGDVAGKDGDHDAARRGAGKQVELEERSKGRVSSRMYGEYLRAWGPCLLLPICVLLMTTSERGLQQFQDFWLSVWSNASGAATRPASGVSSSSHPATAVANASSPAPWHRLYLPSDHPHNPQPHAWLPLPHTAFGPRGSHGAAVAGYTIPTSFMPLGFGLEGGGEAGSGIPGLGAALGGVGGGSGFYLHVYLVLGAGLVLVQSIRLAVLVFGVTNAARTLHARLLRRVMRLPMSFFDSQPTGRLVNRFARDTEAVDLHIADEFDYMIVCMASGFAALVVIAFIAPYILLALAPMTWLYWGIQQRYITTSRELKRLDSLAYSPIFASFSETLAGLVTLRAFRKQPMFLARNCDLVDRSNSVYWPLNQANRWVSLRLGLLGSLIVMGTALVVSVGLHRSPGLAGLAISSSLSLTMLITEIIRASSEVELAMNSVERMCEFNALEEEKPAIIPANRPPTDWPRSGAIEVKDLVVRYRPDRPPVLKGLTFYIHGQEKIGIAGRTGCGKSTLMMALYRIVEPDSGSVTIDGVDALALGLEDLRSRLALVPQDPVIFSGTVRGNLDPFGMSGGDHAIWDALRQAGMAEVVEGLEGGKGLDSHMSEGGGNMSTGQRQLLCMARALLRKSRILVLDEASSNVDNTTDALIQASIRTAFASCTVLTIAHRLHTIMDCTRVLVLDAGRVLEFDSPANLQQDPSSAFYSLLQSASYA